VIRASERKEDIFVFKMIAHLSYGVQEYVCDSYDDLVDLSKQCDLGDKCYVIDENAIYIMNSAKEWKKIDRTIPTTDSIIYEGGEIV
jgi:hypothetical protein